MTNEEIIDRLAELASYLNSVQYEEVAQLLDTLRDRLTGATETITFNVTGSPEVLVAALGQTIATCSSPEDLQRFRSDLINAVLLDAKLLDAKGAA
jgi:hypothetical protein